MEIIDTLLRMLEPRVPSDSMIYDHINHYRGWNRSWITFESTSRICNSLHFGYGNEALFLGGADTILSYGPLWRFLGLSVATGGHFAFIEACLLLTSVSLDAVTPPGVDILPPPEEMRKNTNTFIKNYFDIVGSGWGSGALTP